MVLVVAGNLMALSLTCSCGAAFEVEDTFAGQIISCPDCGTPLQTPRLRPATLRTSGYALASFVLALVGAFTLVGTIVAAGLGLLGLVSIARHRDRVGGVGYAVAGLIMGITFTFLTGFAVINGELFDRARAQIWAGKVQRTGPLEVIREKDGFAIVRPSREWGVATPDYAEELGCVDELVLVNPVKDAFIEIGHEDLGDQTLDEYREFFLEGFRTNGGAVGQQPALMQFTHFKLLESRRLPPQQGMDAAEVLFDVKLAGQNLTYRCRMLKPHGQREVYWINAWSHRRVMKRIDEEVQAAMDSFRLLDHDR